MKVKTKSKVEFQPVDVTFTLESQEELDVVTGLLNASVINRLLREVCPSVADASVWQRLGDAGADFNSAEAHYIGNGLNKWMESYNKAKDEKHKVLVCQRLTASRLG